MAKCLKKKRRLKTLLLLLDVNKKYYIDTETSDQTKKVNFNETIQSNVGDDVRKKTIV